MNDAGTIERDLTPEDLIARAQAMIPKLRELQAAGEDLGKEINGKNTLGLTPLMVASANGQAKAAPDHISR